MPDPCPPAKPIINGLFLLTFSSTLFAQDGDPANGKSLFNTNCAACHSLDKKLTGPALRGVEARLDEQGLDREWISAWIRNSAAVVKSGDAYGNKIYAEYNGAAMTAMPQLSDQDISDILAYTATEIVAPSGGSTDALTSAAPVDPGISNDLILGALALLFMLLAFGLILVNKTLRRFAEANNVEIAEATKAMLIKSAANDAQAAKAA